MKFYVAFLSDMSKVPGKYLPGTFFSIRCFFFFLLFQFLGDVMNAALHGVEPVAAELFPCLLAVPPVQ